MILLVVQIILYPTMTSRPMNIPTRLTDPTSIFIPSVPDDDPSGWDWRPYQMFKDEKSDIAVRVDSIDLVRLGRRHPVATTLQLVVVHWIPA